MNLEEFHRSKTVGIIAVLALALAIAIALWLQFGDNTSSIKREISQANYCVSNADCKVVTGQCPFGCYIPVNTSEGDRIEEIVGAYQSTCIYSCIEYKGVDCIDRKCVVRE